MSNSPSATGATLWRILLRWAFLMTLLMGVYLVGRYLIMAVEDQFMPWYEAYGEFAMMLVVILYVLLMALPFVPGIEISLALLMIFGVERLPIVYFSTLAALTLSFLVGRLVPLRWMGRLMVWLHMNRAARLIDRLTLLDADEKFNLLVKSAPVRIIPFLLRHRYLAVAAAFNMPGNALIGGGGGIALVAGMSGLFRTPTYILMVAIAISPIPLFILINTFIFQSG